MLGAFPPPLKTVSDPGLSTLLRLLYIGVSFGQKMANLGSSEAIQPFAKGFSPSPTKKNRQLADN